MRFSDMTFSPEIARAVERMGYTEMTEVQEKGIPPMLAGKDIVAKAPTGTGKTCAFGIPLLMGLDKSRLETQCLILAPTRELARQITEDLRDMAHFMPEVLIVCVYGGEPIQKQLSRLKQGAHIVVATPGRLLDHMQRKTVRLQNVTRVILDEADEMLDMGFYKDVIRIVDSLKKRKQMGMFSATINRPVMDISWLYQRDPEEIEVRPVEQSMPKITQYCIRSEGFQKPADTAAIITAKGYDRVMVFCNTKYTTSMVAGRLAGREMDVDCLHGDMSQTDRNQVMGKFRDGRLRILVSTDVAARGIDVEDVDAVINYDVPESNEYYTHRIGRTGRAKKEGEAFLLYMPDEERRMREMLRLTRNAATELEFDSERRPVPVRGRQ